MNLFTLGEFVTHAGNVEQWKIECDALGDDDLACVAFMLSTRVRPFGQVEGIPRGGLRLAEALQPYVTAGPALVVDDVLTTGTSFNEFWYPRKHDERDIFGAVIFARGFCPSWITPLLYVTPERGR